MCGVARSRTGSGSVCPSASGMRAVIFDPDAEIRDQLRAAVDEDASFILVGAADCWHDCQRLLDLFVPELVIVRLAYVGSELHTGFPANGFPVLLGTELAPRHSKPAGCYDVIRVPAEQPALTHVLARVRAEIYTRKAKELASLLQAYMEGAAVASQYLSSLRIEQQGNTVEIAMEDVIAVGAYGNYVRLHTPRGVYELRETMTNLWGKLDPARFARVHRSFILNLAYVQDVGPKDSASSVITMSNGMEVPVGPNYRDEAGRLVKNSMRLSA